MSARPLPSLLLALVTACGSATAENAGVQVEAVTPPDAPGVRVETATITASEARLTLSLPGEVLGARDAVLGAALGGFVESVQARSGDDVRKGQPIARINTRVYAAQRDQAAARLKLAQDQVGRLKQLGDLGAAAQLDAAEAEAEIARAGLDLAQVQLSRSVVRAPFTGKLAQIDLEEGEVVSPGAPVARVVQLDPVRVTVSVSDKDVTAVKPGMPVSVVADSRGAPVPGTLVHIDPAADLRTRTFEAEVEVPNADGRLLPGMIATVAIDQAVASGAIVVPQDFLVTRLDSVGVFVVDDEGQAAWRPVTPGLLVRDQVVIESGLSEGDEVVMSGHRALADGDPLLVARTGSCCTQGRVTW